MPLRKNLDARSATIRCLRVTHGIKGAQTERPG